MFSRPGPLAALQPTTLITALAGAPACGNNTTRKPALAPYRSNHPRLNATPGCFLAQALWPLYSPQRSLPPLRERQRAAPTRHVSRRMPLIVQTIPGITQPPVVSRPGPMVAAQPTTLTTALAGAPACGTNTTRKPALATYRSYSRLNATPRLVFSPRPFGRFTAHNARYRPCGSASVRHQHDT